MPASEWQQLSADERRAWRELREMHTTEGKTPVLQVRTNMPQKGPQETCNIRTTHTHGCFYFQVVNVR